jgi:hypothetical protein
MVYGFWNFAKVIYEEVYLYNVTIDTIEIDSPFL